MKGGVLGVDWWWLIALMLLVRGLGLDMIGVARMGSAIRGLHTARRELARLKVEEERVRLARDLHDLLGHTLSMITLKSELARLLIKEDPDRCAQELSEIERVARQTLREVREAVAGYRQPRLESELNGARQLLEAARIDAQIELITGELPPVNFRSPPLRRSRRSGPDCMIGARGAVLTLSLSDGSPMRWKSSRGLIGGGVERHSQRCCGAPHPT